MKRLGEMVSNGHPTEIWLWHNTIYRFNDHDGWERSQWVETSTDRETQMLTSDREEMIKIEKRR